MVLGHPRDKRQLIGIVFAVVFSITFFPPLFMLCFWLLIYFIFLYSFDCYFEIGADGFRGFYRNRIFRNQAFYSWNEISRIEIFPGGNGVSRELKVVLKTGKTKTFGYVALKGNGETPFIKEIEKYVLVILHPKY